MFLIKKFFNTFNFVDNNHCYIFTNIEKILDSEPTNQKTQLEIEKFLYNKGKHILEDINYLGVNINYLNHNINKYCFDKGELITIYLTKFRDNIKGLFLLV